MNNDIITVSEYLTVLQEVISPLRAKISGEIGQLTIRGKAVYFTLRDMKDGNVLSCLIWLSTYQMLGIDLKEGMEVMISGIPEIYKPMGRLTFKANVIELMGEGELKKAYDALKLKLEKEGIFDVARKKALPLYPVKIGLITSREGAVIHDFLNNIGRSGFEIEFINTRVEGARAVADLIACIKTFKQKQIDVLVIIRGGGSLESFIPFNNEAVIREILDASFPVIAGLGHDKDVPLLSLVADIMTSTPTAVTVLLNESWNEARYELSLSTHKLQEQLFRLSRGSSDALMLYSRELKRISKNVTLQIEEKLRRFSFVFLQNARPRLLTDARSVFSLSTQLFKAQGVQTIQTIERQLENFTSAFQAHDPKMVLKRGYSLVRSRGKIVASSGDLKKDDQFEVQFSKGSVKGKVI